MNQQSFDRQVNDALNQVINQLQSSELKTNFVRYSRQLEVKGPEIGDSATGPDLSLGEDFLGQEKPILRGSQLIKIRDSLAIVTEQETYLNLDSSFLGGKELSYVYVASAETDSADLAMELRGDPKVLELMGQTLDGLTGLQRSLEERLDSAQIDTLLRAALGERNLPQNFQFTLGGEEQNWILEEAGLESFRARLFPYLSGPDRSYLYLSFPAQYAHVMSNTWLQASLSLLFSGIVLLGFWLAIRAIYRQKQLSEMKNDFINNMTHELKTPIATISLAADALDNPIIRG
ncbi:MAG: histidine kinase dimerization/phospho-acceptor domain-containing protein, partial [Bacteroidota bacterium]